MAGVSARRGAPLTAAIALATGLAGFALGRGAASAPERPQAATQAVARQAATPAPDSSAPRAAPAPGRDGDGAPAVGATGDAVASTRPPSTPPTLRTPATPVPVPPAVRGGRRRIVLGEVDLTDVGYDRGDPKAPLVLVDLSDFGCPHCGTFARETYPTIEREYIRTGKVYFKYVPFLAGFARGREATRAAECAADQGRFWEMADAIYARQGEWRTASDPAGALQRLARTIGLDSATYRQCYVTNAPDDRTARATRAADALRVRVTPSFVLNGRPIEGAVPLAEFRKLLDMTLLVEEAKR